MNQFDWEKGFAVDFSTGTGLSKTAKSTKRFLSQMKGIFCENDKIEEMISKEDILVYEFYELGCPERAGDLAFGTTILYPGKVGSEFFMTKGHFHVQIDTAEVYYALSGTGYMVMENMAGDTECLPLTAGEAVYVPRGYAHRTVNTGGVPLILFFTFAADAGHDYGTIETKGFRKIVRDVDGVAKVMDNPKW